jgi:hypothetical protein
MNNKFDEITRTMSHAVMRCGALKKLGVGAGLALLVALPVFLSAGGTPIPSSAAIAVTGNSDWAIVPAALTPPFVFVGTDGDFYVRHLPLVGRITLTGRGVSIEGKISADFNAELDATFSGPVWAPVTLTATIDGTKTLIFEGNATGTTVGLVSVGVIKLAGRGPYEGARLEIKFTEIGPGNTDTYSLEGTLIPAGGS